MSTVTDVILTLSVLERDADDEDDTLHILQPELDRIEREHGRKLFPLARVSQHATGGKAMQAVVFIGAYNCLPEDAFIEAIERTSWEAPEAVRLFFQREHDEFGFQEVLLRLPGERRQAEEGSKR